MSTAEGVRLTRARTWALAAGITGCAANALLLLFFAVDQPWRPEPHGTGWLGTANDVFVLFQFSALVPVMAKIRRGALLGIPAAVGVVVLQLLLLAGVLPFEVQVIPVTVGIATAIGWALLVSRRANLSDRAARLGTAIGISWFAGLTLVLLGLLLPGLAQTVTLTIGVSVGMVGFLGFGAWPLWLFKEER